MEEDKKKSGKTEHEMRWYISLAVLVFVLFCCCTMFFFMIYRYNGVSKGWDTIMRVLQPITFGLVIAYLINPIMKFFEKHLLHFLEPRVQKEKKCRKIARSIATGGAVVVFVLIVILLFAMMIPQLISSISGMVNSLPKQVDSFIDWFNGLTNSDNEIIQSLETNMMDMVTYLENWVKESFLPNIQTYITSITSGVINMVKVLMNAIIGLIVSVYVLMTKEKFIGQSKKIVYAIFKPVRGNVIIDTFRKSNEIFGGFISGKLLDSAIIGVLCYVGTSIIGTPYAILVSVIVGVTNVIPFFGPYLGAIPCILLILLVDPIQSLYFLIFILVLQQFDGNILGPKILGESTGLSSFMVIVAIMVGGGLFGVPGMIVGVPVFAVLNAAVWKLIGRSLDEKEMSADAEFYKDIDCVDPVSGKALPMPVKESATKAKMQAVAIKAEKHRVWTGAWNEIKRMFAVLD